MQDRPTAQELLSTIADLLEGDVLTSTHGALKHQVRVAGNLCRILGREAALSPGHDAREIRLLAQVLGVESEGRDSASLSDELAQRLRLAPDPDPELEARAWSALVEIVRAKLAIAKPGHCDYDFSAETEVGR